MQGHFGTPDMQFDLVSGLHEIITSFGLKSIIPSIFTCVGKLIIQFCPKYICCPQYIKYLKFALFLEQIIVHS